jgi:adenine-specific DNA-methyltransferase
MIRSELDVLLDKVQDEALRADLRSQIDRLKQRRSFGLVFEQHIPERVRLPQHPIRVGSQVVSRDDDNSPTFEVVLIDDGVATLAKVRDADGAYVQHSEHGLGGQEREPVDSLVVISDFGEPVLPGFRHLGSVERGGDKPYHVVINGENHHALEALRFTHAGKVDCIYIDPPYNSGARDWKYNNDYVDDADAYRHSKWLAFMERRLKLAKELLNPEGSVLIVTIDEKEYLRLGLLLEQTFPSARMQMITSIINPQGVSAGSGRFSRVDEYIHFVTFGEAELTKWSRSMVDNDKEASDVSFDQTVRWADFARYGGNAMRRIGPGAFFPIFVDIASEIIHSVGDPLPWDSTPADVAVPAGTRAVWPPKRPDGSDGRWRVVAPVCRELVAKGFIRVGPYNARSDRHSFAYLQSGVIDKIESGDIVVRGYDEKGSAIVEFTKGSKTTTPKTVWTLPSHDASRHGANLLQELLPGRRFPFPKSLYAVEDTIRFFVKDKPDAVVLDFFAGSGTTAHAVARLNRQDRGRRQCILVTNNEVSAEEATALRGRGLRPGDPEWEALGIFEHITRPRVTAAITGRTSEDEPIKGDYRFTDEFPMAGGFDENVTFLELRYLDADDIDLGQAFDDIAPLLWLRAGGQGPIARRVDDTGAALPYVWTARYGVLFDEDRWRAFVSSRPESAQAAFIVTYSPTVFAGIAAELPASMDTIRLYDTYLSMFLPARGRP